MNKYTPKDIERFWSKVEIGDPNDCWLWTGSLLKNRGYGTFSWHRRPALAHRVSYELSYNVSPGMLEVLHSCDNPPCCNPNHLWLGTQADNLADCRAKNRQHTARGELSGRHKLTAVQVAEIRSLYAMGGTTHRQLAARYGVSHTAIGDILRNNHWVEEVNAA